MKKRIEIIAMESWGELGNLLAAKTLAETLKNEISDIEVNIRSAEQFCQYFKAVGEKIRTAILMDENPKNRRLRYLNIMEEVSEHFPENFEAEENSNSMPLINESIKKIDSHFAEIKPKIVVGMKGLISRLCYCTILRAGSNISTVNFITNHGLLDLDIHRSQHLNYNFVQFENVKQFIIDRFKYRPNHIRVVGRLLSKTIITGFVNKNTKKISPIKKNNFPIAQCPNMIRILIFCNRGMDSYSKLLEHLSCFYPNIPVVSIGVNVPSFIASAKIIKAKGNHENWEILERLEQRDYFRYLQWMADSDYSILISKTGPNTMLEGVYLGMPQLLLNSGLPMEQWVGPFIQDNGFGYEFSSLKKLLIGLNYWLQNPNLIKIAKHNAKIFSEKIMDQKQAKINIKLSFEEILSI